MYIAGRLRTASSPSRTLILLASYSRTASACWSAAARCASLSNSILLLALHNERPASVESFRDRQRSANKDFDPSSGLVAALHSDRYGSRTKGGVSRPAGSTRAP